MAGGGFDTFWSTSQWSIWPSKLPTYTEEFEKKIFQKIKCPGVCPGRHVQVWNWQVQTSGAFLRPSWNSVLNYSDYFHNQLQKYLRLGTLFVLKWLGQRLVLVIPPSYLVKVDSDTNLEEQFWREGREGWLLYLTDVWQAAILSKKRPVFNRNVSTFLHMVRALQPFPNNLTVESNIRRREDRRL